MRVSRDAQAAGNGRSEKRVSHNFSDSTRYCGEENEAVPRTVVFDGIPPARMNRAKQRCDDCYYIMLATNSNQQKHCTMSEAAATVFWFLPNTQCGGPAIFAPKIASWRRFSRFYFGLKCTNSQRSQWQMTARRSQRRLHWACSLW